MASIQLTSHDERRPESEWEIAQPLSASLSHCDAHKALSCINILHRVDWAWMNTSRRRLGQCGTWVRTTTLPYGQVHMTVSDCKSSNREFTEGLPVEKIGSVHSIPSRPRVVGFCCILFVGDLYRYPVELFQRLHPCIVSSDSESIVLLPGGEETVPPYGRSPKIRSEKVCHLVTSDHSEL